MVTLIMFPWQMVLKQIVGANFTFSRQLRHRLSRQPAVQGEAPREPGIGSDPPELRGGLEVGEVHHLPYLKQNLGLFTSVFFFLVVTVKACSPYETQHISPSVSAPAPSMPPRKSSAHQIASAFL